MISFILFYLLAAAQGRWWRCSTPTSACASRPGSRGASSTRPSAAASRPALLSHCPAPSRIRAVCRSRRAPQLPGDADAAADAGRRRRRAAVAPRPISPGRRTARQPLTSRSYPLPHSSLLHEHPMSSFQKYFFMLETHPSGDSHGRPEGCGYPSWRVLLLAEITGGRPGGLQIKSKIFMEIHRVFMETTGGRPRGLPGGRPVRTEGCCYDQSDEYYLSISNHDNIG